MDNASYIVFIKPDPAGGFVAEAPELPGCLSEGETVAEALQNIQEAIVGVLELRHELGMSTRTNVKRSAAERRAAREASTAADDGCPPRTFA